MGQLDYYLQQGPPQIIALSEVNVPETAAIGYHNQWKARGRHAALSSPDSLGCRVCLVSDFPFRQVQLCKGPALTRHVAGLFDLHSLPEDPLLPGEPQRGSTAETVLIVAFYGQAGNEATAQSQVEEVLACAETSGFRYVILGDFNLEPCQGRLGTLIAQGATVAGDECARGRPLPGTGPVNSHGVRTRRIDFALNHRALPAVSVDHFDCEFSDHLGVHYTYALDPPTPWTGPKRRAVCLTSSRRNLRPIVISSMRLPSRLLWQVMIWTALGVSCQMLRRISFVSLCLLCVSLGPLRGFPGSSGRQEGRVNSSKNLQASDSF